MIEFDPVVDGVKHVTYHRPPTNVEIKFGYGAMHYRDFPINQVRKPDGKIKRWLFSKDDRLRYYR